jgi:membrane protease YdiL (CAAX protease family)
VSEPVEERAASARPRRPVLGLVVGCVELGAFLLAWSWSSRFAARVSGFSREGLLDGSAHLKWALVVVPLWWILVRVAQGLRGERLGDLGLRRPRSGWARAVCIGLATGAILCCVSWGATWLGTSLGAPEVEPTFDTSTPSSLAALVASALLAGAFGEELVYRGFLQDRVERVLRCVLGPRAAPVLSVIAVSALFGFQHRHYGWLGASVVALIGVGLGTLVLRCGRDLAPAMVAHATLDVVGLLWTGG